MYNPKHDIPLAVSLSLAVSLIATYVAAGNKLNPDRYVDSALASALNVPESIDTAGTDSGIWFEGSSMIHYAQKEYIVHLPQIHDDEDCLLFDQIISPNQVTDTLQAC